MKPPPSPWCPWPTGPVTGWRWSSAQAMDGIDPYLAWAEADRFRGYRFEDGRLPAWLPVVIELNEGVEVADLVRCGSPRWLQIPAAYLGWRGLRFCTARVAQGFFAALASGGRMAHQVRRFEQGLPVEHHTGPLSRCAAPTGAAALPPSAGLLRGKVLGLIDGGLALAHTDFLDDQGCPRVRYFWRQNVYRGSRWPGDASRVRRLLDPARAGPQPLDMGYGHELTGPAIAAAMAAHRRGGMVDEDALYRHLQLWDLDQHAHHGTHVMSQACGPRRYTDSIARESRSPRFAKVGDPASRCPLLAVALDWSNVLDTSGGAMNVSVLDGLMYMLSRCERSAELVVNISWGTLAGPHDGTSILESAMDHLIGLRGGRLQIVVPAGNGYQSRTHATTTLGPRGSVTLPWRVQPDDHTQSFLELWLADPALPAERLRDLCIEVRPPGRPPLPALSLGEAGLWPGANHPVCGLMFPHRTALGLHGTCALLALAPTASTDPSVATASPGVWQVTVSNRGLNPVVMDAVIERDDVAMGTVTGARQSYFETRVADDGSGLNAFVDAAADPTDIRRSGSFNSLATGRRTLSVGGLRYAGSATDAFARYSPRWPDPDASRAVRPGVKKLPERWAFVDDSATLWGINGAGSRSGSVVRLVGTSAAAPQIARSRI